MTKLKHSLEAGVGGDVLYRAMQQQTPEALVEEIRSLGGVAIPHEADLSNPENVSVLFDLCEKQLGGVDVLVNNHTHCNLETFDPTLTERPGSTSK